MSAQKKRTPAVKSGKLSDAIADHFQKLILDGALQPGEKLLAERQLAEKLDVSRPSLRDALDKLIDKGLVTTDSNGACYINDAIGQTLRDPLVLLLRDPEARMAYLEFRNIIEAAAAAYAAERASDVDRETLTRQFERMKQAREQDDYDEHANADADFHLAIYEASHNVVLLHTMRSMEIMLRSDVYLNRKNVYLHSGKKDALAQQHQQHQAIYDAIIARDPERARKAAQQHMNKTLETLHEIRAAEGRLEQSLRRLERSDLISEPRKPGSKRR